MTGQHRLKQQFPEIMLQPVTDVKVKVHIDAQVVVVMAGGKFIYLIRNINVL